MAEQWCHRHTLASLTGLTSSTTASVLYHPSTMMTATSESDLERNGDNENPQHPQQTSSSHQRRGASSSTAAINDPETARGQSLVQAPSTSHPQQEQDQATTRRASSHPLEETEHHHNGRNSTSEHQTTTSELLHHRHHEHDDHDVEEDTVTGNWSLEDDDDEHDELWHQSQQRRNPKRRKNKKGSRQAASAAARRTGGGAAGGGQLLSDADLQIYQMLDAEYDRALEEREITYLAKQQSVRQSACFAVSFMVAFLALGTLFFLRQLSIPEEEAEALDENDLTVIETTTSSSSSFAWDVPNSLLFSIYTITTVGYGSHLQQVQGDQTAFFQLYTILFIFVGTATLTIMVAQVYQCLALEASRAQHGRDQAQLRAKRRLQSDGFISMNRNRKHVKRQRHNNTTSDSNGNEDGQHQQGASSSNSGGNGEQGHNEDDEVDDDEIEQPLSRTWDWWYWFLSVVDRFRTFVQRHHVGRGIGVIIPMSILVVVGAAIIGPLEGWSVVESLYFAVVSLTTVGFGDYVPTRTVSIWVCILWLPFSVGFMSLYLANVAAFYIRLSDRNIARIERSVRRRVAVAKQRAEAERRAALRRALRGQELPPSMIELSATSPASGNNAGTVMNGDDGGAGSPALTLKRSWSGESSDEDDTPTEVGAIGHVHFQQQQQRPRRRPAGFDTVPMDDGIDSNNNDPDSSSAGLPLSPSRHLFGTPESQAGGSAAGLSRRERIIMNSQRGLHQKQDDSEQGGRASGSADASPTRSSMTTMKDILRTVHHNIAGQEETAADGTTRHIFHSGPESEFLSIRSTRSMQNQPSHRGRHHSGRKPSFALRVLVQERFSEIIATDIAGYQSNIEIKENTLSVTIDTLRETADKWLVPRRARRAFRAVAFEALYFVGEHGLITRGADALFDLSPFEYHGLFAPLLAALGDAETMEGWLESTNVLAEVDLRRDPSSPPGITGDRNNGEPQSGRGALDAASESNDYQGSKDDEDDLI